MKGRAEIILDHKLLKESEIPHYFFRISGHLGESQFKETKPKMPIMETVWLWFYVMGMGLKLFACLHCLASDTYKLKSRSHCSSKKEKRPGCNKHE